MPYILTTKGEKILLDKEDVTMFKRLGRPIWLSKGGYPYMNIGGKHIPIYFLLIKRIGGMVVDHINRNPLDNRRKNLRLCAHISNTWNGKAHKDSSSGVRGVCYHKSDKSWRAYISKYGKWTSLGYFKDKEDAVRARKAAEKKFYREYAPT